MNLYSVFRTFRVRKVTQKSFSPVVFSKTESQLKMGRDLCSPLIWCACENQNYFFQPIRKQTYQLFAFMSSFLVKPVGQNLEKLKETRV